jgi:hypothetical protein
VFNPWLNLEELIMRKTLDRFIPRQPRYAVEVGIITGEVGETVCLHDRDNQGIAPEKLELLAREGGGLDQGRSDGNSLNSRERTLRDGLRVTGQLRDLDVMFAQAGRDPGRRPANLIDGFERHQVLAISLRTCVEMTPHRCWCSIRFTSCVQAAPKVGWLLKW